MGNKRNASVGMLYLYTMMVVVAFLVLTSCGSRERHRQGNVGVTGTQITEFQVVDINGDTITVHMSTNGGIPSKAFKK
jgi:hypothetical protein